MFKIFSQHFKHLYRRASESRQNQRLKKNTIMLKRDHSLWFIGVFHMIWITVLASSPSEFFESFQVFESLLVFGIVWKWDILMGNENHVSAQLWWDELGAGFSLDGAGFVGATRGRRPWTSSVIISLSAVKHWVHFSRCGHFLRLNKHAQSVCSGNSVAFSLIRWACS